MHLTAFTPRSTHIHIHATLLALPLAIFSLSSLSYPKWSCCEKRLPQPWHRTPFSTSLPSAANRKDKLLKLAQSGKTQKSKTSHQLLFCPVNILHDRAATSPVSPSLRQHAKVAESSWKVRWHVCVGGLIRKSDSTLWSVQPHLLSIANIAVPSLCHEEKHAGMCVAFQDVDIVQA